MPTSSEETMYVPPHFTGTDEDVAERLIAENPFAMLISPSPELQITHLPLLLRTDGDGVHKIIGHVAKANPHWQGFDGTSPATAVFSGPHAYLSPNWYVSPGMVPTWNYAAVHVHGYPVALPDPVDAEAALDALVTAFESDATGNWRLGSLSPERLQGQLKGIVAFEMTVDKMVCKLKMSQNRKPEDAQGAMAALEKSTDQGDRRTAAMMRGIHGA